MATAFSGHNTMLSCLSNLCPLEPEDLILSHLLQDTTEPMCHNCDEHSRAMSKCKDCDELLCDNCVRAHIRVKLTKDHFIVPLEDTQTSPAFNNPSSATSSGSPCNSILNGNTFCDIHTNEALKLYCDTCYCSLCAECSILDHRGHSIAYQQEAVESARNSSIKLLADLKLGVQNAKESIDLSQRVLESINIRSSTALLEITTFFRKIKISVEEREKDLISKLEKSRHLKIKVCQQHIEGLKSVLSRYAQTSDVLSEALETAMPIEMLHAKEIAFSELKRIRSIRSSLPIVDDELRFVPPDSTLMAALSTMGDVSSTIGDGLLRNICSRPTFLPNKNHSILDDLSIVSDALPSYFNPIIENSLPSPDEKLVWGVPLRKIDVSPPPPPGILRKPRLPPHNMLGVRTARNYKEIGLPKIIIGQEGENDGELCRPWGVCCDAEGNIIIADRSNNRIQIFKSDGTFLRRFGSYGVFPGCFDRPAGVAMDPHGRIVVTDKDNHRIQVFTIEGQFVFTFGEKGPKIGQFNYPWDIAVDSNGRIVVSDTRNHRIQLFNLDGTFINKYGFDNMANMVKHFDSPRGVCFGAKGCVIVTDFNNHRLVVIESDFRNARFLGTQGSSAKQFVRPQGVAVDADGNIIVADSRNHRIQVFEANGSFLWQFGTAGKEPGQLDRPSGVCLTPDGRIVVVDFGNNRVQVF